MLLAFYTSCTVSVFAYLGHSICGAPILVVFFCMVYRMGFLEFCDTFYFSATTS